MITIASMNYAHKTLSLYIPLGKFLIIFLSALFLFSASVNAQTVIRDSEIESYLSEWFTPIFQANGMEPSQVKIILIQDNDINAFVAGG